MSTDHRLRRLVFLMLMGASMAGCGRGVFNTEPFVDSRKDEQGNVVLRDTPRMWEDWKDEVDVAVGKESAGRPPGGGIASWSHQWQRVIEANRDRENAPKYIAYIIESRRRAGLPELEDYPPPADD